MMIQYGIKIVLSVMHNFVLSCKICLLGGGGGRGGGLCWVGISVGFRYA